MASVVDGDLLETIKFNHYRRFPNGLIGAVFAFYHLKVLFVLHYPPTEFN
jgi:hypothetical protein